MRRRLLKLAPFAAGLFTAAAIAAVFASSSATSPRYFDPDPPKPSPWLAQPAASTLPGSCQITAQVLDGTDARAGVDVTLDRVTADGSVEQWRAITDKNGVHRFVDVPAGDYQLTATRDDRQPAGAPAWSCAGNGERAFFSLALQSSDDVLTGTVASAAGGKAAGAQIAIAQDVDGRTGLAGIARVPVGVDGSFAVHLLPGKYQLLVQAPHHASMVRKLWIAAKESKARFNLVPAPRVTGRVVDDNGNAVAGAIVAIGGILDPKQRAPSMTTDENGAFSLPVPMDADVVVTARASSGQVARVQLGQAKTALGFLDEVLVTHKGRSVEGLVTKPDGDAWAFGTVHYRVRDLGLQGTEKADAVGHFVVAGMPEDADVEVWAEGNATGAWGAQVATPGNDQLALVYTPPAY